MAPPQWAYQIENYVSEPDEELVCSICRGVFCDPALCPCDHVFCKICITKWLQNNRNCPICRKRVYNSSIKQTVPIVKNLIMKLMLNCHNKSLGCKMQFSVENSEAHVKECEYEFVQCKNTPCTDKLFRKDIVEHETKDCPHRYVKCKNCKCKIPSSSTVMEKHNCLKALLNLVKEKVEMIQKQKNHIKELEGEIETLKATLQEIGPSRMSNLSRGHSLTSSTLSSISPDEITININEYDSQSSVSSVSDVSCDSLYIFANEGFSDTNEESDPFIPYEGDEVREENVSAQETNEYRNAESQTVELDPLSLNFRQDEFHNIRNGNSVYENDSTIVEVPTSVFGETEEYSQSRKPTKRRPTTEKPAKRRLCPTILSSDEDDEHAHSSYQSLKHGLNSVTAGKDDFTKANPGASFSSNMEAGPSSASASVRSSKASASDNSKAKNRSLPKSKQKKIKQPGSYNRDNAVSSRVAVTSSNRVFERTLALLEQYNLESDPEWLPEYASHRGDTTSESDSSYLLESSSNSEFSDVDSCNKSVDDSQHGLPAMSEFMNRVFDSSSEDDPDWRPPDYNS